MKVIILFFVLSSTVLAKEKKMQKIIYKYKKYEKFDFEDLSIEGESGYPGDLSILPRYKVKFTNNLPYKLNFNAEIKKSVERIR